MMLLLLQFVSLVVVVSSTMKLQEQFSWTSLDYAFPSIQARTKALASGQFIPENNLPVGIEVWKDKLFVSVPRWRAGIPSTLNYIPLTDSTPKSPYLIPYPSWEANELGNCNSGMNTVYRIKADACDRLWVLDVGTFGIGNTTRNVCPYTLNVFDLTTNRRMHKYVLRPEDINANTFIANIVVDMGATCDDVHVYLSDELGYGLIVYSWKENKSWRFTHGYFLPDPLKGDFNIAGLNFQWAEEGIFGMALSPLQPSGDKILFFSPLASNREFAVSTIILKNVSRIEDSYHDFQVLSDRGPNQHTTSRVMSDDGIELYNLIDQNAIGCWNSANPHHPAYLDVVDKDDIGLIFPADVKIDVNNYVWVISDRMSTFLLQPLNFKETNFRIFFAPLSILIKGTHCERPSHLQFSYPKYDFGYVSQFLGDSDHHRLYK